ncbi:MAG: DegV family protein [Chloroflexota bacterium]|nr:DegV family protein [Chloroflexota bacterium]
MRKVAIVTDSAANLPPELVARHHIAVVPVLLHWNGHEYHDGVNITPGEVYRHLRQATDGALPRTSTPSMGDFVRTYARAAQEAESIVSVHLSAELSGVYQIAHAASELVDVPVHVLDCRTAAMGCGFTALEAARTAEAGADVEHVLDRTRQIARRVHVYATLETLSYLHRGGHVPAIASIAGSVLKICPILTVENGPARLAELPRTRRRAVARLLARMTKETRGRPVHAAVMHADVPEEAEDLRRKVAARFDCRELFITEFTPIMGAHTGPGVLGVAWWSEERSEASGIHG